MTDLHTPPAPIPPPSRHQLALMIWLCAFPTLTALNVTLGDRLDAMSPVVRTFVLATIAVPIVIYGLMPHAQRARGRLVARHRALAQSTRPSARPADRS
jgi:antibiotic biosynthesis monooxygenase (ABM) superfamily enzyme